MNYTYSNCGSQRYGQYSSMLNDIEMKAPKKTNNN